MPQDLKIGIIGFDTSHTTAFTKLLNDTSDDNHVAGAKVIAGFPSYSPDLEASSSRVEQYTQELRDDYGLQITESIDELIEKVDAVLLESVDGRRHFSEARPVIEARKPLFIDKPLAANYADAAAIVELAKKYNCPLFSSSSLRFDANLSALKNNPELGDVLACDAFGPAPLEITNPGLFWYGIHGVEILYTFIGMGCESVLCQHSSGGEHVLARWKDGRSGSMRGIQQGAFGYGATVFGSTKVSQASYSRTVPLYAQLLNKIVPFLQGGKAPVVPEETLEIMAFMQAALLSSQEQRQVSLEEVVHTAKN